jgi:polyhydroxybutyrate depolymerase
MSVTRLLCLLSTLGTCAVLVVACSSEGTPVVPSSPGADGGGASSGGGGGTTILEDGAVVGPDGTVKPSDVSTRNETFVFAGGTRRYVLAVPVDYADTKTYPLVLEMHGNPGSAEFMLGTYPFDGVSKREAIIVYANAAGTDWDLTTPKDTNGDMNYLVALVDDVASKVSIDKARVLGTGWSGGGFMASQTACRFAGLFKAIAIHAGGAPFVSDDGSPGKDGNDETVCPAGPVATIVVHGAADGTVTPDSGDYAAYYWARLNGCNTDALSDTTPAPCKSYDGCPAATPVRYCRVEGHGHPMWAEGHAASWEFFKSLP